jgi:uncharacterized protein (DUF58 family)
MQGALLVVDGSPCLDEDLFELMITAAASLAEYVLFEGQKVALLSNGGDAAERYPNHWHGETFRRIEDVAEYAVARRALSGFAPLEVPAGRGERHSERLRAALGRLVPADGVTLAELLEVEMPRLPRDLVTIVITRSVDDHLMLAMDGLRRSGIELSMVWVRPEELEGLALPALPRSVPVHSLSREHQLEDLGAYAL